MKSGPVTATIVASSWYVSLLTHHNVCQTTDMRQGGPGVELDTSLGYMLKAAASALHAALEAVVRPLGMTLTHYAPLGGRPPFPPPGAACPAAGSVQLRACPRHLRHAAVDECAPGGPRTPRT